MMTLGAIAMTADHQRAQLKVVTWPGELQGEVRLLGYRKVGHAWQLDSNNLLLQE